MKKLFSNFRREKSNWNFEVADLTESTDILKNPIRGWYQIFTFYAEEEPDFRNISWCVQDADTIALVIINIGAFRERRITQAAMFHMRAILQFFADQQYDVILRVTYDHEGHGLEREPFFFSQVLEHMEQISCLVKEFENTIFVYQGMLVGSWGEMHTSKYISFPKLKEIWEIMRKNMGDKVFFAVRKPVFWRQFHPQNCNSEEYAGDKMGLYDDAILGSETHLGTFGVQDKKSIGWDFPWNRDCELDFENKLCIHVPNGGEALCGEKFLLDGTPEESVNTLQKMHITYLNKTYDKLILKLWKEWKWEAKGIWQNKSVYEYIENHLGYRFCINKVTVSEESNGLRMHINIENLGFANIYQEAQVYLFWKDEGGNSYQKLIETDMRNWNSGSTYSISTDIEKKNASYFLGAYRKRDNRKIYFANQSNISGQVLLGKVTLI